MAKHASGMNWDALLGIADASNYGIGALGRSVKGQVMDLVNLTGKKNQATDAEFFYDLVPSAGNSLSLKPNKDTVKAWYEAIKDNPFIKKNYPDVDLSALFKGGEYKKLNMLYGMIGSGGASGWKAILERVSKDVSSYHGFHEFGGGLRLDINDPKAISNMMHAISRGMSRKTNPPLQTDIQNMLDAGIPKAFLNKNALTNLELVKKGMVPEYAIPPGMIRSGSPSIQRPGMSVTTSKELTSDQLAMIKFAKENVLRQRSATTSVSESVSSVVSPTVVKSITPAYGSWTPSDSFGGVAGSLTLSDLNRKRKVIKSSNTDIFHPFSQGFSSTPAVATPTLGGGGDEPPMGGGNKPQSRFSQLVQLNRELGDAAGRPLATGVNRHILYNQEESFNTGSWPSKNNDNDKLDRIAKAVETTAKVSEQELAAGVTRVEESGDGGKKPKKTKKADSIDISDHGMGVAEANFRADSRNAKAASIYSKHLKARYQAESLEASDSWRDSIAARKKGGGDEEKGRKGGFLQQALIQFRHAAIWQAYTPILGAIGAAAYGTIRPAETLQAAKYSTLGATAGEQQVALSLGHQGNVRDPFRRTSETIATSRMILGGVGWAPTVENQIKAKNLGNIINYVSTSSDIEHKALTQTLVRTGETFNNPDMSQEELMTRTAGAIHKTGQLTSVKGPELQQALAYGGATLSNLFGPNPGEAIAFLSPFIAAGNPNIGRAITHINSPNTINQLAMTHLQSMVNEAKYDKFGNNDYAIGSDDVKKLVQGKKADPYFVNLLRNIRADIVKQSKTKEGLVGLMARHAQQASWHNELGLSYFKTDENFLRASMTAASLYSPENISSTQKLAQEAVSGFTGNSAKTGYEGQEKISNAATNAANIQTDFMNIMINSDFAKWITGKIGQFTGPASYLTSLNTYMDAEMSPKDRKAAIQNTLNDWKTKIRIGQMRPAAHGYLPEDLLNRGIKNWGLYNDRDVSEYLIPLPEEAKDRKTQFGLGKGWWGSYAYNPRHKKSIGNYLTYNVEDDAYWHTKADEDNKKQFNDFAFKKRYPSMLRGSAKPDIDTAMQDIGGGIGAGAKAIVEELQKIREVFANNTPSVKVTVDGKNTTAKVEKSIPEATATTGGSVGSNRPSIGVTR